MWGGLGGVRRGSADSAFGVDHEVAGSDHAVARGETSLYRDSAAKGFADVDRARLKDAVTSFNVDDLAQSAVEDGIGGKRDTRWGLGVKLDVDKHVGAQRQSWVVSFEANF